MTSLLPGYDRPVTHVQVVDRELLQIAQQSAHTRKNWECANGLLRIAYGCEKPVITEPEVSRHANY